MEEDKKKRIAAVQKVLGEPVFCEFDTKTQKIRTTLFLLSVITIAYVLGGLEVEKGSSFLGLKFAGLNDGLFRNLLLGAVAYLAMHFIWCAIDSLLEWRLRITGTKVAYVTTGTFASEHADYPNDPRQSTLYNWWKKKSQSVSGINKKFEDIATTFEDVNREIEKAKEEGETLNISVLIQSLSHIRGEIANLRSKVEDVNKTLEAERVPASLDRFDTWFKYFLKSQNTRWLLIEFLLPISLALWAIYLLMCNP